MRPGKWAQHTWLLPGEGRAQKGPLSSFSTRAGAGGGHEISGDIPWWPVTPWGAWSPLWTGQTVSVTLSGCVCPGPGFPGTVWLRVWPTRWPGYRSD